MYRPSKDYFGAFLALALGVTLAVFGVHFYSAVQDMAENFLAGFTLASGLAIVGFALRAILAEPQHPNIPGMARSRSLPERRIQSGSRRTRRDRRLPNLPRQLAVRRKNNRRRGRDRRTQPSA